MIWTDDAKGRLERVPAGFMRNTARNTVEEYAKEIGFSEITLEIVEAGLAKSKEKMSAVFQDRSPQELSDRHDRKEEVVNFQGAEKEPYECGLCGLVKFGGKPDQCPSCHFDEFRLLTEEERNNISKSAGLMLIWDQAALEKLEHIPPGYMRQMTKYRVEHWARKCGIERVTVDVVGDKYRNWEEGTSTSATTLEWSAEARSRLEKIPQFIRSMVGKEIEQKAKALSKNLVDNEAMSEVILAWSKHKISFHFGKE